MKKILSIIFGVLTLILIIQINGCKDNKGVTEPENISPEDNKNSLSGIIDFPFDSSSVSDLTIGFGQKEYHPDSDGKFTLTNSGGNIPGVAIVYSKTGTPNLMSLIPKPDEIKECKINVHSTAISLVFLNPFICTSNAENVKEIVTDLEQLVELSQFETLLQSKLISNYNVLTSDDYELQSALNNVIVAYLNSVTADTPKTKIKKHKDDPDIVISPGNIVSGHQVQHIEENNFSISNWYGRWAKCIIPGDDFYLPPNGDLLDVLKWSPLWAASQRDFEMEIIPNDPPKEINVYGLGFAGSDEIKWEELTAEEQNHILNAGLMTVLVEFVPRAISVLTNTSATFGSGKIASDRAAKILGLVFNHYKIVEKARKYIGDGDYSGFYWEMTKEYLSLIVNDDEFRAKFIQELGITLTESALKTITAYVILPFKVLFIADDLTGLAKSVLALYNAKLKTTFEIYSEEFKFGNVNGNVYDENSGAPIQDVKVQLTGDENNPMNPNYIYTTDASGGFWFENILAGKKSLIVSKKEYGGKTVEIEVKENEITEVTITLSKEKGTITGRVVNEIFIKNGITPANFNKECHLDITEIGGNNNSYSFWIGEFENGVYTKELTPGTYEIKAWHEDYKEATVTVTITGDQTTQVEDLVLKPDCKMQGSLYYDINFDNSYEYQYSFEASESGGVQLDDWGDCPDYSSRTAIVLAGINNNETIQIFIDTSQIKESGYFSIGGIWNCGCAGLNGKTTVLASTKRFKCTYGEEGYQSDLMFSYTDDPDNIPCNCGITKPGSIVLTRYGNKLTDVIEGSINVTLAGWKGCECSCCDEEGNHTVDCAKIQMDISFKILVGSLDKEAPASKKINNGINTL